MANTGKSLEIKGKPKAPSPKIRKTIGESAVPQILTEADPAVFDMEQKQAGQTLNG